MSRRRLTWEYDPLQHAIWVQTKTEILATVFQQSGPKQHRWPNSHGEVVKTRDSRVLPGTTLTQSSAWRLCGSSHHLVQLVLTWSGKP